MRLAENTSVSPHAACAGAVVKFTAADGGALTLKPRAAPPSSTAASCSGDVPGGVVHCVTYSSSWLQPVHGRPPSQARGAAAALTSMPAPASSSAVNAACGRVRLITAPPPHASTDWLASTGAGKVKFTVGGAMAVMGVATPPMATANAREGPISAVEEWRATPHSESASMTEALDTGTLAADDSGGGRVTFHTSGCPATDAPRPMACTQNAVPHGTLLAGVTTAGGVKGAGVMVTVGDAPTDSVSCRPPHSHGAGSAVTLHVRVAVPPPAATRGLLHTAPDPQATRTAPSGASQYPNPPPARVSVPA